MPTTPNSLQDPRLFTSEFSPDFSNPELAIPSPDFDSPLVIHTPGSELVRSVAQDLAELGYTPEDSAQAEQLAAGAYTLARDSLNGLGEMTMQVHTTFQANKARLKALKEADTARIEVLRTQQLEVFTQLTHLCTQREPIQMRLSEAEAALYGTTNHSGQARVGLLDQLDEARRQVRESEAKVQTNKESREQKLRGIEEGTGTVGYTQGRVDERWDQANTVTTTQDYEDMMRQTTYGVGSFTDVLKHSTVETPKEQKNIHETTETIAQLRSEVDELETTYEEDLQDLGAHSAWKRQLEQTVRTCEEVIERLHEMLSPIDEEIAAQSRILAVLVGTASALNEELASRTFIPQSPTNETVLDTATQVQEIQPSYEVTTERAVGHIISDTTISNAVAVAGAQEPGTIPGANTQTIPERRFMLPLLNVQITIGKGKI